MNIDISAILDKAEGTLQGEPARAIGYGAAAIVYIVARIVVSIPDVSPEDALALSLGYVATVASVIESIRHYVSPAKG